MSKTTEANSAQQPFFGAMGCTSAIVFTCFGAAYGTAKSGVGISAMGVLRPDLIVKSMPLPRTMALLNEWRWIAEYYYRYRSRYHGWYHRYLRPRRLRPHIRRLEARNGPLHRLHPIGRRSQCRLGWSCCWVCNFTLLPQSLLPSSDRCAETCSLWCLVLQLASLVTQVFAAPLSNPDSSSA